MILIVIIMTLLYANGVIENHLTKEAKVNYSYGALYIYDLVTRVTALMVTSIICFKLKFGSYRNFSNRRRFNIKSFIVLSIPMILLLIFFSPFGYYFFLLRIPGLRTNMNLIAMMNSNLTQVLLTIITAFSFSASSDLIQNENIRK